jgi:hypothetical protein
MNLKDARKLCEDMTVAAFVMSGWRHAMEGHYNFADPSIQPNATKSYFTVPDPTKQGNALGSKIMDAIQSTAKRQLRGDAADSKVLLVYREFEEPIGKTATGADCNIMRVVLGRGAQNKPIIKSCYPVSAVTGTVLT